MRKSIFVSSTFKDFQRERDLLQRKVELRTNELLRNIQVSFLDFRWGIDTTGETNLEKVVSICIAEVLNSRPFYVIMLGDTYGSCVDNTVAHSLYVLNGLSYDGQKKSVTQIEIEATGLFEGNRDYVLVLDRHTDQTPDPQAAMLKQKVLEAALPENIYTYTGESVNGSIYPRDEEALIDFVSNRIFAFLKDHPALTEPRQISLAKEQAQRFHGRQDVLSNLTDALNRHSDGPIFRIHGPRGAGLTAILCKLFTQLQSTGFTAAYLGADTEMPAPFAKLLQGIATQLDFRFTTNGDFFEKLDSSKKYIFILDGFEEIEKDTTLRDLLRRGCIPENILFMITTKTPDKAHFSLGYPTKSDALALFESTLQDYRKELPQHFRNYFRNHIPEEMVRQPAFLKQFISALCYLTEEDYRQLGRGTSFMDDLADLFVQKLDHFPSNEQDHIRTTLQNSPESQLWLLGLLSIAPAGVDSFVLMKTLAAADIPCSQLDLHTVKELFRDDIHCSGSGLYSITRDSFREAVQGCFTPVQIRYLRYLFADHLTQNLPQLSLPEIFSQVAYQYLMLEDYPLLARLLETNHFMSDQASANGLQFSLMCGDFGADAPSRHYLALAAEKNPYCSCWLVRYAMPYLTHLYQQNGTQMFSQMYKTVRDGRISDEYAADLLSMQLFGMALQLHTKEAGEILTREMPNTLTGGQIALSYLVACMAYNSEVASNILDLALTTLDISNAAAGGVLSILLRITERMDGNALHYRPLLEQFFAMCEAYTKTHKTVHTAPIAIYLLYLSLHLQIPLSHRAAVIDIINSSNMIDLDFGASLMLGYVGMILGEEELSRNLVELMCNVINDRIPLDTLNTFCLSAHFRMTCYHTPDAIAPASAARFARDLYRRLWKIRGGVFTSMQMVEMVYLGCMVCLYEGNKSCQKLMEPMLKNPKVKTDELLKELEFFRSDAQDLIGTLGADAAKSLNLLEATWKKRKTK